MPTLGLSYPTLLASLHQGTARGLTRKSPPPSASGASSLKGAQVWKQGHRSKVILLSDLRMGSGVYLSCC